jgi:hypothetical protein
MEIKNSQKKCIYECNYINLTQTFTPYLVKNSENSTEKEKLAKAQIFDENGTLVVDEDNILKSEIEKPKLPSSVLNAG